MDAHPLRGRVRWVIFPLMSAGLGGTLGLGVDALNGFFDGGSALLGSGLALSAACGVVVSKRPWIGVLVSTVGGLLTFASVKSVHYVTGASFRLFVDVLLDFAVDPLFLVSNLMLTGLIVTAAWLRLRRGARWGVLYAAGPLFLTGVNLLADRSLPMAFLAVACGYFLGQWAALEGALRLSKRSDPRGEC